MAIGPIGWTEGVLIAFVLLLLFGARRLPEIGQSLGKGIKEFKKSLTSSDDEAELGPGDRQIGGKAERSSEKEEVR